MFSTGILSSPPATQRCLLWGREAAQQVGLQLQGFTPHRTPHSGLGPRKCWQYEEGAGLPICLAPVVGHWSMRCERRPATRPTLHSCGWPPQTAVYYRYPMSGFRLQQQVKTIELGGVFPRLAAKLNPMQIFASQLDGNKYHGNIEI